MAISPEELRSKTFAVVPKGYDRPEVNRYLGAIADELNHFNRGVQPQDQSPVEPAETLAPTPIPGVPAEATPRAEPTSSNDFDRVGTEISLMLRHAQDSATKIREDADLEARTLVEQVRLDIEADRVAHEHAARELISRTEERAGTIRLAAEDYDRETRASADRYSTTRKAEIDAELSNAESEAATTRQRTADRLASANQQAEAILEEARSSALEITNNAERDARIRRDEVMDQARSALQELIEAEERAREDLDQTRRNINSALAQLSISKLDLGEQP